MTLGGKGLMTVNGVTYVRVWGKKKKAEFNFELLVTVQFIKSGWAN
jgi:hypothetical protein